MLSRDDRCCDLVGKCRHSDIKIRKLTVLIFRGINLGSCVLPNTVVKTNGEGSMERQ